MELRGVALHRRTRMRIIISDTRQHGCDRQGVNSSKVARTDARASSNGVLNAKSQHCRCDGALPGLVHAGNRHVAQFMMACLLTLGLCWALIQARITGQAAVEEVKR